MWKIGVSLEEVRFDMEVVGFLGKSIGMGVYLWRIWFY